MGVPGLLTYLLHNTYGLTYTIASLVKIMACDDCSAIYLRLALIMQNEEFLRELKRNEDFMRTLEFERGKNNSYCLFEHMCNHPIPNECSAHEIFLMEKAD